MFKVNLLVLWIIFILNCSSVSSIFLVVPEDVPTALVGIYGFAPKLVFGKDHRVGFGFRFGNHADFQVVYELGPQEVTRPLPPIRTRSAVSYRQRIIRQRPLIRFLLRSGLLQDLQEISYKYDVVHNDNDVDNDPGPR